MAGGRVAVGHDRCRTAILYRGTGYAAAASCASSRVVVRAPRNARAHACDRGRAARLGTIATKTKLRALAPGRPIHSARELLRARRESSTCAPRLRYTALVERSPCKPALDALLSDVDTPISPAERGAQRLLVGRSRSGEALAQAGISSAMNARRRLQPRLTVR